MAELDQKSSRIPEPVTELILDGKRFKVVYEGRGPYIRADGKGEIAGVGFLGIIPA
jgi:hypothetical protein